MTRTTPSGGTWAIIVLAACAAACGTDAETLGTGSQEVENAGARGTDRSTEGNDQASNPRRPRGTDSGSSASSNDASNDATDDTDAPRSGGSVDTSDGASDDDNSGTDPGQIVPPTNFAEGPAAGNPDGSCTVPGEALPVDTSQADNVVGNGTPASCTADAFIDAVAEGGLIRFDCGPDPITITLDRPAKVFNDASDDIVIDGGGKVTLSGGGKTRILYMNTCDQAQHWTTAHCDNQETPRLTVQNLTFVD
ncbi:MAG TPA: hypothetical protein VMG12_34795, partial [Polyangiaceae bacterium]|nr:hypothetical protein [Polyangiaceae bacterium]